MGSVTCSDFLITALAPLSLGPFFYFYKIRCPYKNFIFLLTLVLLLLGPKTHNPVLCSVNTIAAITCYSPQIWRRVAGNSTPPWLCHFLSLHLDILVISSILGVSDPFLRLSALWLPAISSKVSFAIDYT